MDSSGSTLSSLATTEASQMLRDLLNVGKPQVGASGGAILTFDICPFCFVLVFCLCSIKRFHDPDS